MQYPFLFISFNRESMSLKADFKELSRSVRYAFEKNGSILKYYFHKKYMAKVIYNINK